MPASDFGEGDGIDPREEKRKARRAAGAEKRDYSALRLGQRVRETVGLELSLEDLPELDGFAVREVRQDGAGKAFTILVSCLDPGRAYDPERIRSVLNGRKAAFRAVIAASVRRKRVPELMFIVLPPGVNPGE